MIMPKGRIGGRRNPGGHHDWISRDYEEISCQATGCKYNVQKFCMVPSRCEIGPDGKCKGFEAPPLKTKVDGD